MIDKKEICSKYLNRVGRPICYVDSSAKEIEFYGVIEQTWRRNKTLFEDVKTKLGRVENNYYMYIGPYEIDICNLPESTMLFCDGDKYEFLKKDKFCIGNAVQFYFGVLRKIEEDEYGYFE